MMGLSMGLSIDQRTGVAQTFAQRMALQNWVGWWRMSGVADASGNGHTLVLDAAPDQTAIGGVKNDTDTCTKLDGSAQAVHTPYASDLDITGDLTIVALVRRSNTNAGGLVTINFGGTTPYDLSITAAGHLEFNNPFIGSSLIGTATLAVGVWYFVAVTRIASTHTIELSVNGVSDISANFAEAATAAGSGVMYIGLTQTGILFGGWIDEVAITNRVLPMSELLAIANLSLKTKVTCSLGHYAAPGITFTFDTNFASVPVLANLQNIEVAVNAGAYLKPTSLLATSANSVTVNFATPAAASGDAWRINDEGEAFGLDHYLAVPETGVTT